VRRKNRRLWTSIRDPASLTVTPDIHQNLMDGFSLPLEYGAILVSLAGGLALFLYGLHKMTEALKVVAGERVKDIMARLTTNRVSAAFAGAAVTAVIQSSSITTVLLVGFITAGLMTFSQSIGVILGANVGTTITAQIIAFKITKSALLLIAAGFFTEVLAKHPRVKQFGIMSMGLGLLFFGMELMSQATEPLRHHEAFMQLMREMTNPLTGIAIGALFTALIQSSSATTGIVIIMASQGLMSLETGIALILGSNIGTCVTAYISAIGRPREAMQAATAHTLFNVIGVLLFAAFIPVLADFVRSISPASAGLQGLELLAADTPRQIANAHTVFNVINLLLFLGFTGSLAKLVLWLVPSRPPPVSKATEPAFLDNFYLDQPALALDRARREVNRLGQFTLSMIRDSLPTLTVGTRERIDSLQKRDVEIDALHNAIVAFLRKLSSGDLVNPQPKNLYQLLSAANYIENIAEIIRTSMVADSYKRLDKDLVLSEGTLKLLRDLHKELYLAGQISLEALAEDSSEKAQMVLDSKAKFRGLVEHTRSHLYIRLTTDSPERLVTYKIESNVVECFSRIHALFRHMAELIITDTGQHSVAREKDNTSHPENTAQPAD
jgi:phosphate:Na+ symporter